MVVNSKRKGNSGERECSKILAKYLGGNFQRVASSGAHIGGKNQVRKESMSSTQIRASKSDIIPPDEYPNLVIECKSYKDLPYHGFVTSINISNLDTWIKELKYDCDDNDFGILCFKTNRKKWTICFDVKYQYKFNLKNYSIYNDHILTGLEDFLSDDHNSNQVKILSNEVNNVKL